MLALIARLDGHSPTPKPAIKRGNADWAKRLKEARELAGFEAAAEACDHFEWVYPTYAGHENGYRGFGAEDAVKYARAYEVSLYWLLTGAGVPRGTTHPAAELFDQLPLDKQAMVLRFMQFLLVDEASA
jgi:hypothetical protein